MSDTKYDVLKIKNQLCFPLYACSREVIRQYKPFLDKLDLTYTQYITMLVLWEARCLTAKELGEWLRLDSGTLTPLLKKMEQKGLLTRKRSTMDERHLVVTITEEGEKLKDRALAVPQGLHKCVPLEPDEAATLYRLLYKILGSLRETEPEA